MAGAWLYENAPAPEYRAHISILQGKAEKEAEEAKENEREAEQARNQAS